MKKYLPSILLAFVITMLAQVVFAQSFKPATLEKGEARVRVDSKIQADSYFAQGYTLSKGNLLGFGVVTDYSTVLSSSMTSVQSTVPVATVTTKDGHVLTMADLGSKVFLNIEPGGTKEELVMCTGISGTTWTGCTRGLALYGTSTVAVSANRFAHNANSRVIMSNVHYVYNQYVNLEDNQTKDGVLTFTSSPIVPTPTTTTQAANKSYVDGVAIAGGADASQTVKGISKLSSNPSSSTNPIALNSEEVSATSSANKVVRSNSGGKIDIGFIDQTLPYTWTNTSTFSGNIIGNGSANTLATTTFSAIPTIPTSTPSGAGRVIGLNAAGKLPAVDGSLLTGISATTTQTTFTATRVSSATDGTVSYAHGLGVAPNSVIIHYLTGGAGPAGSGAWNATAQRSIWRGKTSGSTGGIDTGNTIHYDDGAGTEVGTVTVDATNVNIGWTKTSSPDGTTLNLLFIATR